MRLRSAVPVIRLAIVVAAAIVVTAAAAPLTWHLLGHQSVVPDSATPAAPVAQAAAPIDLSGPMALAPFGRVATAAPAEAAAQADVNLVLLGVIARDDPARSLALIAVDGVEANFRPGDQISERAVLTAIAQDRVTVEIDGTPRDFYFLGRDAPEGGASVPTGAERLAALFGPGGGQTISEKFDADQRAQPETTQDYIDMWRDRIRANPGQVLDTIGLVATEKGYMVAEEHDAGVNRAGLQSGDIVTSVNGQAVGDVEKDRALYDAVAASGVARIEVERNGRTIVMSFPLQ